MLKFIYVFLLALSSVNELSVILEFELNPNLSDIHLFLLISVLVGYALDALPKCVSRGGLMLSGIISFIFMIAGFIFNTQEKTFNEINSYICLLIWYKSAEYININQ